MAVGTADLAKGIEEVWYDTESGPNVSFTALWPSSVTASDHLALHEGEAAPSTPFPYCIYEIFPATTIERNTGGTDTINLLFYIQNIPIQFRIHAKTVDGDSRTAKEIAAHLMEQVMKSYGGHPTVNPTNLNLDHGRFLQSQYQTDFSIKTGDNEYEWDINYIFKVDVPVKTIGAD